MLASREERLVPVMMRTLTDFVVLSKLVVDWRVQEMAVNLEQVENLRILTQQQKRAVVEVD